MTNLNTPSNQQQPAQQKPDAADISAAMLNEYYTLLQDSETLSNLFLDTVKLEIERANFKDINNVQALLLYNIGDNDVTVGELIHRGFYTGSNASYNVRKLTESGYLVHNRSPHDRRSIRVSLTQKGQQTRSAIKHMVAEHVKDIAVAGLQPEQVNYAVLVTQRLIQYLNNNIQNIGRGR